MNLSVRPLRVSWLRGYWPFPDHFLGWNDECVHAVDCYDSNSNHTLQHSFQEITYNCIHYINMYISVKFICIIVRFPRRLAPYIIQPFYHHTKMVLNSWRLWFPSHPTGIIPCRFSYTYVFSWIWYMNPNETFRLQSVHLTLWFFSKNFENFETSPKIVLGYRWL